ncbi:hypothetical protein SEMRO_2800_G337370.1 [Seminavis robusta]|uniref:Uncharacterized protein n=1 Tax=Seminavis robusta TaxID=568900 RepID=A0A9N8F0D9_9STRA|nr:hypothetical protein SEMRO_2800_G337370.1 [Seminavis robusta]|eukprot:Sro2800_g337370.1 n/a (437) ;mRNA; r:3085-4395
MHADDIDDGFKTDSEDDAASQLSLKLDTDYWNESIPFDRNAFGSPTLAPFDPMSPQYQGTRSAPPTPQTASVNPQLVTTTTEPSPAGTDAIRTHMNPPFHQVQVPVPMKQRLSAQLDTAADATTILSDPDAYPSGDEQRFSTNDERSLEPTIPSNLKSPPSVQPSAENDDGPDIEEFLSDHEYDDEYIASDVPALTPRASRLYSATDDEDDAFDAAIRSNRTILQEALAEQAALKLRAKPVNTADSVHDISPDKPAAKSPPEVQILTIASVNSFETTAVASVNSFETTADISPVELSSSPPATPKIANTQPDAADDDFILDYMIPATSTTPSLVTRAMPRSSMTQHKPRHRPNLHVESDIVADASGEIAQQWNKVASTKKGKKKSKKKKKKATCPSTSNICAELFSPTNKESDSSSSSPTSSEGSNSKPSPTQDFA